jgi:hypothetical protein
MSAPQIEAIMKYYKITNRVVVSSKCDHRRTINDIYITFDGTSFTKCSLSDLVIAINKHITKEQELTKCQYEIMLNTLDQCFMQKETVIFNDYLNLVNELKTYNHWILDHEAHYAATRILFPEYLDGVLGSEVDPMFNINKYLDYIKRRIGKTSAA